MFKHAELPKSGAGSRKRGVDLQLDPISVAPPAQFGRLALWVASASALVVGVVGTAAYGVWFNNDQRAYVDAMANARQALGISGPTSSTQQASGSGPVTPSSSPSARADTVVNAQLAPPAFVAAGDHAAASSVDSVAPQLATAGPGRMNCISTQNRRHLTSSVEPDSSHATHTGGFFRHINYRQHGSGIKRDTYAH